jgi:beta-lactamase class A
MLSVWLSRLAAPLSVVLLLAGCVPRPVTAPTAGAPRATSLPTPAAHLAAPTPRARATPAPLPVPPLQSAPAAISTPALPTPAAPAVALVPPLPLADLLAGALPEPSTGYGLVVQDMRSGARLAQNEHQVFPSASLYKLALAWQVFQAADTGRLDLDAELAITDDDAQEVEPDGGVAPGETPSVREALAAMLSVSSNAAAHALLRVLGRHEFNLATAQLGLNSTRVPEDEPGTDDDPSNPSAAITSADDMARLLGLLATGQGLSPAAHTELVQLLATGAPPDALRETLPESVQIFDKTGNLADASNVGALLQSTRGLVVLVVVDQGVNPGDARGVIAQLGQAIYDGLLRPPDQANGE